MFSWVNKPLETRFLTFKPLVFGSPDSRLEPLHQGQSFEDKKGGLTITNVDDKTVEVTFEELPPCKLNDFKLKTQPVYVAPESAQKDLICTDIKCTFKRKEEEIVAIVFRFTLTNHNSYSCPGVNIKAFLKDEDSQASNTDAIDLFVFSGQEEFM